MGHYIENTGDTPLRFLEMFKSSYYADVSLDQWMALTPPELVEVHLKLDQQVISRCGVRCACRKSPSFRLERFQAMGPVIRSRRGAKMQSHASIRSGLEGHDGGPVQRAMHESW